MKMAVNGKQMKQIDNYTINTLGIPSLVLMERAGYAVFEEVVKLSKNTDNILVICGSGNNGADGVVVARILQEHGLNVSIYEAGNVEHYTDEMKMQMYIANNIGINIVHQLQLSEYNIIIDAIFGIGLSRNIEGNYQEIIREINDFDGKVISVDIPSGINPENGQILGVAVKADVTVTFGTVKIGNLLYPGAEYSGEVVIKKVGFPQEAMSSIENFTFELEKSDIDAMVPERKQDSNKGTFGKLLVAAGNINMCGAAVLCANAAYRGGAGLVKILSPIENRIIIQSQATEAVFIPYVVNNIDKIELNNWINESKCIVCGPGLGRYDSSYEIVKAVLESKKPTVLDADAINVIREHRELEKLYHENLVITPHLLEFSRLIGVNVEEIKDDIINKCRDYAMKHNITCVLKDSRTIISSSTGKVWINTTGNSGLATGGSGDVLAGTMGALICQDMSVGAAAVTGVYLHGMAADLARTKYGEHGLKAGDLPEYIAKVMMKGQDLL